MKSLNPTQVYNDHPAETAGPLATAVAVIIAELLGLDDAVTIGAIAIILSFVPAIVTTIVMRRRKRKNDAPTTLSVPPARPGEKLDSAAPSDERDTLDT